MFEFAKRVIKHISMLNSVSEGKVCIGCKENIDVICLCKVQ